MRLSHTALAAGSRAFTKTAGMLSKGRPFSTSASSSSVSRVAAFGGALSIAALVSASEYGSLQDEIEISDSALSEEEYRKFKVVGVEKVGPNTKKITIQLPEGKVLGTWPVSSVSVKAEVNGKQIERQSAPISPWNSSLAEIIVKQPPNENPTPSEMLEQHLYNLKSDDRVELKGPHKLMKYKTNSYKKIGILAHSTGIVPLIQVIMEAMFSATDYTEIKVILCNENIDNILLRDELDALWINHDVRLEVYHVLADRQSLDEALVYEMMPSPVETREGDGIIMVAGPDSWVKAVADKDEGFLTKLKYDAKHVQKFPSLY